MSVVNSLLRPLEITPWISKHARGKRGLGYARFASSLNGNATGGSATLQHFVDNQLARRYVWRLRWVGMSCSAGPMDALLALQWSPKGNPGATIGVQWKSQLIGPSTLQVITGADIWRYDKLLIESADVAIVLAGITENVNGRAYFLDSLWEQVADMESGPEVVPD